MGEKKKVQDIPRSRERKQKYHGKKKNKKEREVSNKIKIYNITYYDN